MRTSLIFVLLAALLLTGCESMPDRVRDRFSTVKPKTHVYTADRMTVYFAAQMAFKRLDFVLTKSSPGDIEAVSRIHSSAAFGDSRQLLANLQVGDSGPGQSEVQLWLTQQVQSQSVGGTSQEPLREHSFFDTYFATLQQVLEEEGPALKAKKG